MDNELPDPSTSFMEIDTVDPDNENIILLKDAGDSVEIEFSYDEIFEAREVTIESQNEEFLKVVPQSDSESISEGEDLSSSAMEIDDAEIKEQERKLTEKFLDGKLTFSEYAALMGGNDVDIDGTADGAEVEDLTLELEESPKEDKDSQIPTTSASENTSAIAFEIELQDASRKRRRNRTRKRRNMPPALLGLMGEANLRYARGDREMAVKMCLEVIRQAPTAPEPFQTLAVLHEELGEPEKSLQFALIAAHLSPGDPHEWQRLAEISIEQGDQRQAITCLTRAIKASPTNPDVHLKLAQLLDEVGDKRLARRRYHRTVEVMIGMYLKGDKREVSIPLKAMELAKSVARMYHGVGELDRARQAIEVAFFPCPKNLITHEDINLMLELLIELNDYKACLNILMSHCGVVFEITDENVENGSGGKPTKTTIQSCLITEDLPIDIHAKMLVVMIHLRSIDIATNLMKPLFELDPEDAGDLYLDVAEALMSENHHKLALTLLNPLVLTKNYGLAAVWLRKAECLRECSEFEDAVVAYKTVVQLAPGHAEARLSLSEILRRIGRRNEALEALIQDPDEVDALDPVLLYERCRLLIRELGWNSEEQTLDPMEGKIVDKSWIEKAEDLLNTGQLLISRHCAHIKDEETLYNLTLNAKARIDETKAYDGKVTVTSQSSPFPWQDEWKLLQTLCSICLFLKWPGRFQRLAFSALSSNTFNPRGGSVSDINQRRESRFLALLSAFFNNDSTHGYYLAKDLVIRESCMPRAWVLFVLSVLHSFDARHNRFIMRMFAKSHFLGSSANADESRNCKGDEPLKPDNLDGSDKEDNPKLGESQSGDISRPSPPISPVCLEALALIHAHNCLISGTYKYALFEYATLYQNYKNPIVPLLISISLLHMACQKFTVNKHSLVVQSIALFYEYSDLRHKELRQEVHYNLGRLMHQLGLFTQAIFHYEKALSSKPPNPENATSQAPNFNLQREIAYNLHLIYMRTGAKELARSVIEEYIVI
ncbi:hypothetical protein J437_LFUL001093 [Ladona fulva]|uniref:General transcription factor 3C polypeptide 3 n=1 Tax=Ladona fulva TaxID=123851 RepID=A0A8K0NW06_LADFU|nr:hypothetical protein J437_LFUL001093 [Ladona fulva]